MTDQTGDRAPRVSPLYDPKIRAYVFQAILLAVVVFLIYAAADNAFTNLKRQKIASGFGFWDVVSGFDINQRLIDYSATSTYGRAFWVGLLNTLIVAAVGIVLATFLGFAIGIARLSSNWIVAKIAMVYVEVIRNLPLLLQLFFWYNAVLKPLPNPRQSIVMPAIGMGAPAAVTSIVSLGIFAGAWLLYRRVKGEADQSTQAMILSTVSSLGMAVALFYWIFYSGVLTFTGQSGVFLNNRGIIMPDPTFGPGSGWIWLALLFAALLSLGFARWAKKRQAVTGRQSPVALVSVLLLVALPLIAYHAAGKPMSVTYPELKGFNFTGGMQVYPEFFALLLGLTTYTAGFIAEIVRAGILAVPRGQTEAANALGLRPGPTLKLVVIPQAMRVIIPPLTSNYLNLTKNSSLAVFIGYPDLVQIFTGTVLNQTGQAVEVVAITMLVYLTISLTTAGFMNWYNARKALVER